MKYQIESKKERIVELQEALKNLQAQLKEEQDKARTAFEENMNTVESLKTELSAKIEAEKTLVFRIEKLNNENADLKLNLKDKIGELADLNEKYKSAKSNFKRKKDQTIHTDIIYERSFL